VTVDRRLTLAAVLLFLPTALGCHIGTSTEVTYRTPAGEIAKPETVEPAKKRNELSAGILPPKLQYEEGAAPDAEAGRADDAGRWLQAALEDARIFREVKYPLRDEQVDVVIEPVLTVKLAKNRLTNALTAFPGLVLPWCDGFGFDYDHWATLETRVLTPARERCDRHSTSSHLVAERYPSILWLLGIHVGVLMLMIFESASTDHLVREQLIERNVGDTIAGEVRWLSHEFAPEAKACPIHPDAPRGGKFCVYCGRNLWYPILNRRDGKDVAAGGGAPGGGAAPRPVTDTAR
jgi:hypothetical protein